MWLEECRQLCQKAKFIGEEVVWRVRDNHAGSLSASSVLLDENRTVIPGLQFHGEVQGRLYGPYQKYALLMPKGGRRLRVFMLEVMPSHKRSHVEPGLELYGPHIQLGDEREPGLSRIARQVVSNLDVRSINGWIERFRRHAKVYDGGDFPLSAPFENDLFGL